MTMLFWFLAALLAAAALAFVLPALLARRDRPAGTSGEAANIAIYRDQLAELEADLAAGTLARAQYDEARHEIERRLLDDVRGSGAAAPAASAGHATAIAVGLAVPLLAALLYFGVGNPGALSPQVESGEGHAITRQQIESMVARLAERMQENPEDVKGWVMLGRSYAVLDRYPEAAAAYANAVKRSQPDAQLLADYADALAMAQGRTLEGEPEQLIRQALKVDPKNVKALALAGTAAFQRKDFRGAIAHWQAILEVVPPDSDIAESVKDSIGDAQKMAGIVAKPAPAPKAAAGAAVSGTVGLAPALTGKAAPDDTVFIFARAAEGPRLPLAVIRKRVRDLPAAFTLDDSMAMTPAAKLSGHERVVIGARVSKSGDPVARPGDLEGLSAPVRPGASGVRVEISAEIR